MALLRDTRSTPTAAGRAGEHLPARAGATVHTAKNAAWAAEQAVTDRWITAKVKTHFVGPTLLPDVTVDTRDHVVTLKGIVPSNAERERAAGLARATDRVTRVVNRLEVR